MDTLYKSLKRSDMRKLLHSWVDYLVLNGRQLVLPFASLISGIIFQNLVSVVPWSVERWYSRFIYPFVLNALSPVSRSLSFSIGEVLTGLVILIAFACAVFFCVGLVRRRGERRSWVLVWLRYGVWVSAGLLWLFFFAFGLNYQRPLLFELLNYEQRRAESTEL